MKKIVLLVVLIFMLLTLCSSLACGWTASNGRWQGTVEAQNTDDATRRAAATMAVASPEPSD